MYSLAPFYKAVLLMNMVIDTFANRIVKYLPISAETLLTIKKNIIFTIVKLKPHHTKSIIQYSDGSCDTFEM